MSWTRVSAVLPAVLAACAKVSTVDEYADAGTAPQVASIEPAPGSVAANARFTVRFSEAIDEGQLLAATGRSETVGLAADADVERAAAAIEHASLSAHERTLLIPAQPEVAADRKSIALAPDQPLRTGKYWLLLSPRLKDDAGRKLAAARFGFAVDPPKPAAKLIFPQPGADAPSNLSLIRARAISGRVALVGPDGSEAGAADAQGDVTVTLAAPLVPGGAYALALDGVVDRAQSFTAGACPRDAAPALAGGAAALSARDTSVEAALALDWPARVEVRVAAGTGEPCTAECATANAYVACAARACGPQGFDCKVSLHVEGLEPATDYTLRAVAADDLGHETRGPLQKFTTIAPLPRVVISEVMVAPPAPQEEAEYVEILNLGPGVAVLDSLSFLAADGIVRPLVAAPPPVSVRLAPGERALAAGSAFDPARYPSLPPGTPVLRASTQRLLGRGLSDGAPPSFRLMLKGAVELAHVPAGVPHCADLQRDETVPPEGEAAWTCGPLEGTPGT